MKNKLNMKCVHCSEEGVTRLFQWHHFSGIRAAAPVKAAC